MVRRVSSAIFMLRPSTATRKLCDREHTSSSITLVSLMTIGRIFRLWGATGVMQRLPLWGTMIGPPLDKL